MNESLRRLLTGLALALALPALAEPVGGFERFVREDGSFAFPGESVRDELVHLGSWFVPAGPAAGFQLLHRVVPGGEGRGGTLPEEPPLRLAR